MPLLREFIGEALRHRRAVTGRTLRDVSGAARVSLGYLSEVERGRKEASSELLAAICDALDLRLSDLLAEVGDALVAAEPTTLARLEPLGARGDSTRASAAEGTGPLARAA